MPHKKIAPASWQERFFLCRLKNHPNITTPNLDKPKRKHIKFLESILFGFGLSKLGVWFYMV